MDDDRVRCEDCAHYGPVSKWHPSRDQDGAHRRVTLPGCLLDRAHTVGARLRRCQDFRHA